MKKHFFDNFKLGSLLGLCLAIFCCSVAFGQGKKLSRADWQKLHELKVKVVVQNMSLSQSQKQQFVSMYRGYNQKLHTLYHQKHNLDKNSNSTYVINERLRLEQQIVTVKKNYKSKFLKVITPKQLEEMYQGEDNFKQMLIKRLRQRRK